MFFLYSYASRVDAGCKTPLCVVKLLSALSSCILQHLPLFFFLFSVLLHYSLSLFDLLVFLGYLYSYPLLPTLHLHPQWPATLSDGRLPPPPHQATLRTHQFNVHGSEHLDRPLHALMRQCLLSNHDFDGRCRMVWLLTEPLFLHDRPYAANEVFVTGTFDDWGKTVKLDKHGDRGFEKNVSLPEANEKLHYKV